MHHQYIVQVKYLYKIKPQGRGDRGIWRRGKSLFMTLKKE
jgi:hypothetical protein